MYHPYVLYADWPRGLLGKMFNCKSEHPAYTCGWCHFYSALGLAGNNVVDDMYQQCLILQAPHKSVILLGRITCPTAVPVTVRLAAAVQDAEPHMLRSVQSH